MTRVFEIFISENTGRYSWYQSVGGVLGDNQYIPSDGPSAADPHHMLFGANIIIGYASEGVQGRQDLGVSTFRIKLEP